MEEDVKSPPPLEVQSEGPIQIINITADDSRFVLNEGRLDYVTSQIPQDMKIAVVSVVGAFRTGKSFLLDLFLKYLTFLEQSPESLQELDLKKLEEWMSSTEVVEGNESITPDSHTIGERASRSGFKWRSGRERMTTGIWVWSRPFIIKRKLEHSEGYEKVAVLIMDTQGMFDNETGQFLTASIFGLSTLLSSYQIYNVVKLIQEDNLQHLALFSEYARVIAEEQRKGLSEQSKLIEEEVSKLIPQDSPYTKEKKLTTVDGSDDEEEEEVDESDEKREQLGAFSFRKSINREELLRQMVLLSKEQAKDGSSKPSSVLGSVSGSLTTGLSKLSGSVSSDTSEHSENMYGSSTPVFQRLEFLVRDAVIEARPPTAEAVFAEAQAYLERTLSRAHLEDLRIVREQILSCFRDISCALLPHPGLAVAEGEDEEGHPFRGEFAAIRPLFRTLCLTYLHSVFADRLQVKKVAGRPLRGRDLGALVRAYVALFAEGSKNQRFPDPGVLLKVTADISNRAAAEAAEQAYLQQLEALAGPSRPFVGRAALQRADKRARAAATALYLTQANFGPAGERQRLLDALQDKLAKHAARIAAENAHKDPFKAVLPALLVAAFFLLNICRFVIDFSCSLSICGRLSGVLGFLATLILIYLGFSLAVLAANSRTTMHAFKTFFLALVQERNLKGAISAAAAAAMAGPPIEGEADADAAAGGSSSTEKENSLVNPLLHTQRMYKPKVSPYAGNESDPDIADESELANSTKYAPRDLAAAAESKVRSRNKAL